jgi:ATP-dependent Clp protease protease subunit
MDFGKEFKRYAMLDKGVSSMHFEHYVDNSLTPYIIEERQPTAPIIIPPRIG